MRISISLVCIATLLAACTFPTSERPEPNGVSFTLNGTAHSTTQVSGGIGRSALGIGATDYDGFPELQFGVSRFTGTNVYPITAFDSTAAASVRPQQSQPLYHTALFGGRGQIVVTGYSCRTSTGRDPVTGIDATVTLCTIAGTFAFSAMSQSGDSVVITNGHFRCTVPLLPAGAA